MCYLTPLIIHAALTEQIVEQDDPATLWKHLKQAGEVTGVEWSGLQYIDDDLRCLSGL